MTRRTSLVLVGMVVVALGATAVALINPNFTPIHLIEQSELVLVLKFEKAPVDGKVTATVEKVLKGGDKAPKSMKMDLYAGAFEEQGKLIAQMIANGQTEALMFVGFFEEEGGMGGDPGAEDAGARGFLHIGGKWVAMSSFEAGLWDMEKIDSRMLGTWAGSTDMLLRAVNYVLTDEEADIPIKSNAEWAKEIKFADLKGKVNFAKAIDIDGDGKLELHIGCDAGDRLYAWEGGALADVTAKYKLDAKSKYTVWADLDGDGKLDLVCSDGKTLNRDVKVDGDVVALCVVTGADGKAKVVACTATGPVVEGTGALKGADAPVATMFIADFDGDALADILTIGPNVGYLYKGTAPGVFADAVKTQIALGKGITTAQMGDYDADGLPDIFVSAEDRNRFWQNMGKGKFSDMLGDSGEITYISKPGGVDGIAGDINNDGRQDVLIAYDAMAPQIFFNRGFRSFGHARMLDLAELRLLPESGDGQQACTIADLNGDGAQDMVLILKNGEAWVFPRRLAGNGALAVTARIARDAKAAHPVTVSAWRGKRRLGSWVITDGSAPAFFGVQEAGPVVLKWQFPGGEEQTKKVLLIDKRVDVTLTPR